MSHLHRRTLKGMQCRVKKNSCSRVSCSYNSAIFLCNDNDIPIAPECSLVAGYALKVIDHCKTQLPSGKWYASGKYFNETGGWNAEVRYDKC